MGEDSDELVDKLSKAFEVKLRDSEARMRSFIHENVCRKLETLSEDVKNFKTSHKAFEKDLIKLNKKIVWYSYSAWKGSTSSDQHQEPHSHKSPLKLNLEDSDMSIWLKPDDKKNCGQNEKERSFMSNGTGTGDEASSREARTSPTESEESSNSTKSSVPSVTTDITQLVPLTSTFTCSKSMRNNTTKLKDISPIASDSSTSATLVSSQPAPDCCALAPVSSVPAPIISTFYSLSSKEEFHPEPAVREETPVVREETPVVREETPVVPQAVNEIPVSSVSVDTSSTPSTKTDPIANSNLNSSSPICDTPSSFTTSTPIPITSVMSGSLRTSSRVKKAKAQGLKSVKKKETTVLKAPVTFSRQVRADSSITKIDSLISKFSISSKSPENSSSSVSAPAMSTTNGTADSSPKVSPLVIKNPFYKKPPKLTSSLAVPTPSSPVERVRTRSRSSSSNLQLPKNPSPVKLKVPALSSALSEAIKATAPGVARFLGGITSPYVVVPSHESANAQSMERPRKRQVAVKSTSKLPQCMEHMYGVRKKARKC